jgi:hypothetical protein
MVTKVKRDVGGESRGRGRARGRGRGGFGAVPVVTPGTYSLQVNTGSNFP